MIVDSKADLNVYTDAKGDQGGSSCCGERTKRPCGEASQSCNGNEKASVPDNNDDFSKRDLNELAGMWKHSRETPDQLSLRITSRLVQDLCRQTVELGGYQNVVMMCCAPGGVRQNVAMIWSKFHDRSFRFMWFLLVTSKDSRCSKAGISTIFDLILFLVAMSLTIDTSLRSNNHNLLADATGLVGIISQTTPCIAFFGTLSKRSR